MANQAFTAEPPWEPDTISPMDASKSIGEYFKADVSAHQRLLPSSTSNNPSAAEGDTAATTVTTVLALKRTPDTTIMDMPPEILREIFYSIDGEFSRTLWSLCLTCKHFRNSVEEHCEPEYNLRGKWIEDPYPLMEKIRDQPYLRRILRVLRMEHNFVDYTSHSEEDVESLVTSLGIDPCHDVMYDQWCLSLRHHNGGPIWLSTLLPEIETIELSTHSGSPLTGECVPLIDLLADSHFRSVCQSHGFEKLQNLTLSYPSSLDGYHRLENIYPGNFMLPNLRKARLFSGAFNGEGWNHCWPSPTAGTSSLTELEIFDSQETYMWHDYTEHWDTFKGLKILHLHILHVYLFYVEGWRERQRYVEVLTSQAHSLEDLRLYSNEQYLSEDGTFAKMSPYCPGQPSLKHFSKLRSLALTDMSLIGVSDKGPTHWYQPIEVTLEHLAAMFPETLESFTHLLWNGPTSFSKALPIDQQALRSWGNIWKTADTKHFPCLKKIMIQKYGVHGLCKDQEVIWEKGD